VIVVMDIRHPLKEHDVAMLELASARSVPVHVLLTKADKLGRGATSGAVALVRRSLGSGATVQAFSAMSGGACGRRAECLPVGCPGAPHGGPKKKPRLAQRSQPGKTKPGVGG
jgi:GTP-binding protein